MTNPLPPDPEGMNDQRADTARIAAASFARQAGLDHRTDGWEVVLGDLLGNLIHLCDREGIPFRDMYRRGVLRYQEETDMPLPFIIADQDGNQVSQEAYPTREAAQEVLDGLTAFADEYTIVERSSTP